MPRLQNDALAIGVTQINVGLSTTIAVSPINYQSRIEIGQISGGTLFVSGVTGAWITGRPFIAANNTFNNFCVDGAPPVYRSRGRYCVVHLTYYLTQVP